MFLMLTFMYRNSYIAFANEDASDFIIHSYEIHVAALKQAIEV